MKKAQATRVISYCCNCKEDTVHERITDDEYFKYGLLCVKCMIVWEATPWDDQTVDEADGKDEETEPRS